jgi:hypothetical protein
MWFFSLLYHINNFIYPLSLFLSSRPQSHDKRRPELNLLPLASHYNPSLQPDSPTLRLSLNSASLRRPCLTTHLRENSLPATNETFCGTRTDDRDVEWKPSTSIRSNSDSVSNDIDESNSQYEKQYEQRI